MKKQMEEARSLPEKTNRKKQAGPAVKIIIAAVSVLLLAAFLIWLIPELHEKACRKRFYTDLNERLPLVSSASVRIIQVLKEDGGTSYSMGASAVAIAREGTRYYAMTANHVVSDPEFTLRIMTMETLSWAEYKEEKKGKCTVEDYFGEMPEAEVVYRDETYDLAIVAFKPLEYLEVPGRTEENPAKECVRPTSCPSMSLYLTIGPAMSCGKSTTYVEKVRGFFWWAASPR